MARSLQSHNKLMYIARTMPSIDNIQIPEYTNDFNGIR